MGRKYNLANAAEITFSTKDQEEVYKEAHRRKDGHTAIFYAGKLPEDLVVVFFDAA